MISRPLSSSVSFLLGLSVTALGALSAQSQPVVLPAPKPLLEPLNLSDATVQDLALPLSSQQQLQIRVNLGGVVRTLLVEPHDLRAPGFRLWVEDEGGIHEEAAPPSVTFRGVVQGAPGSAVGVSLIDGQLSGVILLGDELWGVQPATDAFATLPRSAHVVYRGGDVAPLPFACATEEAELQRDADALPQPAESGASIAQIAFDLSFRYYTINGSSVSNSVNAALTTLNGVDTIYIRDVGIDYTATEIIVRRVNTLYTSTNPSTIVNQFRNTWNSTLGGIQRDIAHLLTGFPSGGTLGIAFLATVCNRSLAYGVSWYQNNLTVRVAICAHELGHGWNAPHCSGSGCRIMCAFIGGCSGIITSFGTSEKNSIIAFRNTRTCLN